MRSDPRLQWEPLSVAALLALCVLANLAVVRARPRLMREAVASLGVPYNWLTSYVAGDKIYCLHEAEDAETIVEHARRGGFPADVVSVVASEFGPQTASQ